MARMKLVPNYFSISCSEIKYFCNSSKNPIVFFFHPLKTGFFLEEKTEVQGSRYAKWKEKFKSKVHPLAVRLGL